MTVVPRPDDEFPRATAEWFLARGAKLSGPSVYAIPSRCPKLTCEGLCSIHEEKPLVCAVMPVGGEDCLGAVRRRRTPEQYQKIREEHDPEVIHG
jgi:Fe-S-cluster containining protein